MRSRRSSKPSAASNTTRRPGRTTAATTARSWVGVWYWRVKPEYEAPDSFNQALWLERCPNPDMVRLDPDYRDPDGGDRNWGYVLKEVPKDEFADRWPDAEPLDFSAGMACGIPTIRRYWSRTITSAMQGARTGGVVQRHHRLS